MAGGPALLRILAAGIATTPAADPMRYAMAAGCNADADCNLNGVCLGDRGCQCDAWWAGPRCSELRLGAVDPALKQYETPIQLRQTTLISNALPMPLSS